MGRFCRYPAQVKEAGSSWLPGFVPIIPVTRCQECESDCDGTGNRERLLEALGVATARMIRLAVANARPGAGPIVFIPLAQGQSYRAP